MRRRRGPAAVATVAAAVVVLAACSGGSASRVGGRASRPAGPTAGSPASLPPPAAAPTAPATTAPAPTTTTTTVPFPVAGWTPLSDAAGGVAVEKRTVVAADGSSVMLLRFRAGRTRLALHVGSTDPPSLGYTMPPDATSSIGSVERAVLLAAFNGGFRSTAGVGGFEVDGVVLRSLVAGEASLVIDATGQARVAVWGNGAPRPGEAVKSVRQNLPPLIYNGQPSRAVDSIDAWGATLGGRAYVARSALGTDPAGNLVYAASSSAIPVDLSTALIAAGCVTAMELDINPYWVQADVAAAPGATLVSEVPYQNRPVSQYLAGWTRDFITVLAAS